MPDNIPTPTTGLDEIIKQGWKSTEEAKALVTLHMADRLQLDPYDVDYDIYSKKLFGKSAEPEEYAHALQQETKFKFEKEDIDDFNASTPEDQLSQAVSGLNIDGELSTDDNERVLDEWRGRLLGKSKKHVYSMLKPYITEDVRLLTRSSLLTGEVDHDAYLKLSQPEREVFQAYTTIIDPERANTIKGIVWEPLKELGMRMGFAPIKAGLAVSDTLAGWENVDPRYAMHAMDSYSPNWRKLLKPGGIWADKHVRGEAIKHIARLRHEDAWGDVPFQTILDDTTARIDDIAKYALIEADDRDHRKEIATHDLYKREEGGAIAGTLKGTVGVLGSIGSAMASGGTSIVVDAADAGADLYEKMRDVGVDKGKAGILATAFTIPYILIEKMQIKQLKAAGAPLTQHLISKRFRTAFNDSLKEVLKKAGLDYAKVLTQNVLEESLQAASEKAVLKMAEWAEGEDLFEDKQLAREWVMESAEAARSLLLVPVAGAAVKGASYKARAHIDPNWDALQNEWIADAKFKQVDDKVIKSTAKQQWSMLSAATKEAYITATSDDDAQMVLSDAGVIDSAAMHAAIRQTDQIELMKAGREVSRERAEFVKADIVKLQNISKALTKAGFDIDIVEELSQATDESQVASIDGNKIELLNYLTDKGEVLTHEAFHGARNMGIIEDADLAVVLKAIDNPEYAEIMERYKDMPDAIQRWEDVAADIVAIQPEEGNIIKRVIARIKDFFGIITNEKDVARKLVNSLNSHKADKAGIFTDFDETQLDNFDDEAYTPELTDGQVDVRELFAEQQQEASAVTEQAEAVVDDVVEDIAGEDLEQIEADINKEYDAGVAIDTLMRNFYKSADKTKADKDSLFVQLYANDYRSLENAIASNNPARVKKSAIVLRNKMRKWDAMKDDAKLKLLQLAESQGVQFARRDQFDLDTAAHQYATGKLSGQRNTTALAKSIAKRSSASAEDIADLGELIVDQANRYIDAKSTIAERIMGIDRAASAVSLSREMKDVIAFGIREGKTAGKAQQRVLERRKQAAKRKMTKAKAKASAVRILDASAKTAINIKKSIIKHGGAKAIDHISVASTMDIPDGVDQTTRTIESLKRSMEDAVRSMVVHTTNKSTLKQELLKKASAIGNVKTVETAQKHARAIADAIQNHYEHRDMISVGKAIEKTLAAHGKKLEPGKRMKKGKYVNHIVGNAKELWEMSKPKYDELHEEIYTKSNIKSDAIDIRKADDLRDELYPMLQAFKIVDEAKTSPSLASYNKMYDVLNEFITTGSERFEKEREARNIKEANARADMSEFVKRTPRIKNTSSSQTLFAEMNPIDATRFIFGPKAGDKLATELDRVVNRKHTDRVTYIDDVDEAVRDLTGRSFESIVRSWGRIDDKYREYSLDGHAMSKDNLAYLIALTGRQDMIERHLKNNEKFAKTYAMRDKMLDEFSTAEKAVITHMIDKAEKYYRTLDKVVLDATGIPLTVSEGYVKAHWNIPGSGHDVVMSAIHDIPSFLKPTRKHKYGIDETRSFTGEMVGSVEAMAMFKHGDATQQFIGRTALGRVVSTEVEAKYGKAIADTLRNKITEAFTDKSMVSLADQSLDGKAIGIAKGATAVLALSARPSSMARQGADVLSLLHEYNITDFTDAMKSFDNESRKKFFAHPLVKDRIQHGAGLPTRNALAMLDMIEKIPFAGGATSVLKVLTRTSGYADAYIMSVVGTGLLKAEMAKSDHVGKSEENRYEDSMAIVVGKLERVYQSSKAKDLNDKLRNMDNWRGALLQFTGPDAPKMSAEIMKMEEFRRAMKGSELRGEARKQFVRTMVLNHLVLALPQLGISFFMQNIVGDDEWDEDEILEAVATILMGPYRAMIMVGMAADGLVSLASGRMHTQVPAYRTVVKFYELVGTIKDEFMEDEPDYGEIMFEAAKLFGAVGDADKIMKKINE